MSSFESYYYKNIGEKFRYYREKFGMTQEQLSSNLGKNDKYIGHIERCERFISNRMIIKLLKLWELQPEEFYKFDEKYKF